MIINHSKGNRLSLDIEKYKYIKLKKEKIYPQNILYKAETEKSFIYVYFDIERDHKLNKIETLNENIFSDFTFIEKGK